MLFIYFLISALFPFCVSGLNRFLVWSYKPEAQDEGGGGRRGVCGLSPVPHRYYIHCSVTWALRCQGHKMKSISRRQYVEPRRDGMGRRGAERIFVNGQQFHFSASRAIRVSGLAKSSFVAAGMSCTIRRSGSTGKLCPSIFAFHNHNFNSRDGRRVSLSLHRNSLTRF